jgi:anti-anti-sigma regulatory factor
MKTIHLFSVLNTNTLHTREVLNTLDLFMEYDNILIDFSKIDYISRSFADELVKTVGVLCKTNNIDVLYINMPPQIESILKSAKRTQIERLPINSNLEFKSIKTLEELEQVCLSW